MEKENYQVDENVLILLHALKSTRDADLAIFSLYGDYGSNTNEQTKEIGDYLGLAKDAIVNILAKAEIPMVEGLLE